MKKKFYNLGAWSSLLIFSGTSALFIKSSSGLIHDHLIRGSKFRFVGGMGARDDGSICSNHRTYPK